MDTNSIMNTNIVDTSQTLYNYDKEMNNMSYVIMMKCSDGIVCVSDSRLTTTIQNANNQITNVLNNDTSTKVFKNKSLIIGVFGNYDLGNQSIDIAITNILKSANTKFEFAEQFLAQIVDTKKYTMFIGEKKNNSYEAVTLEINKGKIHFDYFGAVNYNSNLTNFSHSNLPLATNPIPVAQAQPLLISAVQNVIDLQSNLLPFAFVGGKVQCEVLQ